MFVKLLEDLSSLSANESSDKMQTQEEGVKIILGALIYRRDRIDREYLSRIDGKAIHYVGSWLGYRSTPKNSHLYQEINEVLGPSNTLDPYTAMRCYESFSLFMSRDNRFETYPYLQKDDTLFQKLEDKIRLLKHLSTQQIQDIEQIENIQCLADKIERVHHQMKDKIATIVPALEDIYLKNQGGLPELLAYLDQLDDPNSEVKRLKTFLNTQHIERIVQAKEQGLAQALFNCLSLRSQYSLLGLCLVSMPAEKTQNPLGLTLEDVLQPPGMNLAVIENQTHLLALKILEGWVFGDNGDDLRKEHNLALFERKLIQKKSEQASILEPVAMSNPH